MLCDCIPVDVWTEMALELLDASDLVRADEATEGRMAWSPGAVFHARRILDEPELKWFACQKKKISVMLLERCIVGAPTKDDGLLIYSTFRHMKKVLGSETATTIWARNGKPHRTDGGPAVESLSPNGDFVRGWYEDGHPCRAGGLPVEEEGRREEDGIIVIDWHWLDRNGEWHREDDLPCYEDSVGNREWWIHGERHRDGGRPAVENADGSRDWWTRGRRRTNGGDDEPTLVTARGDRCWYAQLKQRNDVDDCDDEDSRATLMCRSECSDDFPEELQEEIEQFKATHSDWMSVPWKTDVVSNMQWRLAATLNKAEADEADAEAEDLDDSDSDTVVSGATPLRRDLFDHRAESTNGHIYAAALHRGNNKPAIECQNGDHYWYQLGLLHRDNDQPAVELHNGDRQWFRRGKLHRVGGPAKLGPGGVRQWYLNGAEVSEEEVRYLGKG